MSLLIYSGLLYLVGVSVILALKPELMFSKDGNWKEFGLGRNHARYTWMPFWLFVIIWAIISYLIILVIASNTGLGGVSSNTSMSAENAYIESENIVNNVVNNVKGRRSANRLSKNGVPSMDDMKKGYYLLNTNETVKNGVPKYIYLGPKAPNLVYQNMEKGVEDGMNERFDE